MSIWKDVKVELPTDFIECIIRFSDDTYMITTYDPIYCEFDNIGNGEVTHWTEIPQFNES